MVGPVVILPHHGVGPHSTFGRYSWKALNGVEYTLNHFTINFKPIEENFIEFKMIV